MCGRSCFLLINVIKWFTIKHIGMNNSLKPAHILFRILFTVVVVVSLSFFVSEYKTTFAQTCGEECCACDGPGEYCCQYGEMCCTGGGCPSWECATLGYTPTTNPPDCPGYTQDTWTCCAPLPWDYQYSYDCNPSTVCDQRLVCTETGQWCTSWRWVYDTCYRWDCLFWAGPWCAAWGWVPYDCGGGLECTSWENRCTAWGWEDYNCRTEYDTCFGTATCSSLCIQGDVYRSLGTCEWCPAECVPGGGNGDPPPPGCTCDTAPGAPLLGDPVDGSATNDTNIVDFNWNPNGWGEQCCASRAFRLQVDNNSDFSSPEYDSGNTLAWDATSTTTTLDEPEGQMFWRMRAVNDAGGTWSASKSFTLSYEAPTAQMDSPAGGTSIGTNVAQSFSATATDIGGLMLRMQLARVADLGGGSYGPEILLDEPGGVVDEACSGANCTVVREWTPISTDVGNWLVYMNAFDNLEAYDGKCTGAPIIPAGLPPWSDCGRTGLTDVVSIIVANDPPTGTQITGPGNARLGVSTPVYDTTDYAALFNHIYADPNKQEVRTTWGSTCPMTQEVVQSIDLRVRGTDNAGWPVMDVVMADSGGVRSTACSYTVNWGGYQVVNCVVNQVASTVDVVFTNDNSTRDLFVDYIDLIYTDTSTRRIQAESNDANGDYVIYDRADTSSDPLADPYDGIDVLSGRETMVWAGSLRFPVPISFQPVPSPATCTLSATVTDIAGAVGNTTNYTVDICGGNPGGALNPLPTVGEQNVPLPVTLTWNAPADWGDTCGVVNRNYTIHAAVRLGGVCPDPDTVGSDIDYTSLCAGTLEGSEICTDPFFVRDTEYCWYVESNNGEYSGLSASTGNDVWWFEVEDPLTFQNWVTTLYGDFYAGGLITEFPDPADYLAPWDPPHAAYEDAGGVDVTMMSSNDISISSSDTTPGYFPESESSLWVEFANFSQTWPTNYKGFPPSEAIDLPLSGNPAEDMFIENAGPQRINADNVYQADVTDVANAINNTASSPNGYSLRNPGVAIVYVTGSGDLRIDSPFTTNNDNYRIVFVTGPDVNVVIDEDLSVAGNPDFTTAPLIEAAFIVQNSIEFEGIATQPGVDPEVDPDDSIVVEGPIIAKIAQFNRNRGPFNSYPAEIIRYNNDYIYNLTEQERSSDVGNYTGLFVIDVDWISEE